MPTSYPGGLDAFTNPTSGDAPTSPSHASQHANANDAIEAVQAELGIDPAGSHATVKARLDSMPKGVIGYALRTTDQASIGAPITDLTGLSVTVNVATADRLIRVTGYAGFNATAAEIAGLLIREGATQHQDAHNDIPNNVTHPRFVLSQVLINPTAGNHTYKLSAYSVTGSAFLTMKAGASFPAFILVEDIGNN